MRRRALIASLVAGPLLAGAAASRASEPAAEKKKGGGPGFLQLPALTANAARGDGRRGVLTVDCGLDIPDAALRARAESAQPRLRAAYIQALQAQAAAIPAGGPPNPDLIAAALQRITDQVLGRPGARFLIGAVMIN
jgi:flagellar basal body-associated protein FliL